MSKRYEDAKRYTEKYKDILKPCKYCGSKDINICTDRDVLNSKQNLWFVACSTPKCDCTGSYTSVKKAIEAWNNH